MSQSTHNKFNLDQIAEDFRHISNDPGTWPFIPRVVILLGVFLAVLVVGWLVVWQGQSDKLAAAKAEEETLKSDFVTKKTLAVNLDAYRQQLDEIDRSFGILLKQLPNRSEVESLLVEINQAGLGRGMQFELFKPSQESIKDFYAELPISVKATGNYHDFGEFASDIAKLPRIVTLNDVNITRASSATDLVMEMNIKTFRYLDQAELDALEQKKKEAKNTNKKGKK